VCSSQCISQQPHMPTADVNLLNHATALRLVLRSAAAAAAAAVAIAIVIAIISVVTARGTRSRTTVLAAAAAATAAASATTTTTTATASGGGGCTSGGSAVSARNDACDIDAQRTAPNGLCFEFFERVFGVVATLERHETEPTRLACFSVGEDLSGENGSVSAERLCQIVFTVVEGQVGQVQFVALALHGRGRRVDRRAVVATSTATAAAAIAVAAATAAAGARARLASR